MEMEVTGCVRCPLAATRTNVVAPRGADPAVARLVLVGEGPGRDEDQQGSAFVGRSGQLLDKVLTELGHDSVFITNCVRCRPPGNRNPEWYERAACFPYLEAELAEATGTVVALGKVAHHNLLERKIEHEHVWHPAFVLRDIKRYDEWKTQFPPA